MNRKSASCAFCESPEAFDAHGDGALMADAEVLDGEEHPAMFIYLMLPGGHDSGAIQVTRDPMRNERRVWFLSGDPRQPETLNMTPSIHLVGAWHGWLRNGRLASC